MEIEAQLELAREFIREARALIEELERSALALERGASAEALEASKRVLHTLKGNAGLLGAKGLQTVLHGLESDLLQQGAATAPALLRACDALGGELDALEAGASIDVAGALLEAALTSDLDPHARYGSDRGELRVAATRMDALVAAAGELLVHHGQLARHAARKDDAELRAIADRMESVARRLHAEVLRARMIPVAPVLSRHTRLVRDEAQQAGKRARLEIRGNGVELDKVVLDAVAPALVHLVKNAVAHGLEAPEVRRAAGKPEEGRVRLSARPLGSAVELIVEDDGRGLDRAAIASRATALGLDAASRAEELVFAPGLSTAALDLNAGRGVGLDAVRRAVGAIGGALSVDSAPGQGTTFRLRLPASVALHRVLLFQVREELFALPSSSVGHAFRVGEGDVRWVGKGRAVEDDGALLPLIEPGQVLQRESACRFALVLDAGGRAALPVDALLGHHELVMHPVAPDVRGEGPVSGAALAPDGRLVLQLDPHALVASVLRPHPSRVWGDRGREHREAPV